MGWCLHPIWGGCWKKIFRYANLSALSLSYPPHFPNPRNIPGLNALELWLDRGGLFSPPDMPGSWIWLLKKQRKNIRNHFPRGLLCRRGVWKIINVPLISCFISETIQDRGIIALEDEQELKCHLLNGASFSYLEWPRTHISVACMPLLNVAHLRNGTR